MKTKSHPTTTQPSTMHLGLTAPPELIEGLRLLAQRHHRSMKAQLLVVLKDRLKSEGILKESNG